MLEPSDQSPALEGLWEREMWTDVYLPVWRDLETSVGGVTALVFETNKKSSQFAGDLSDHATAQLISTASGKYGSCRDYLESTFEALQDVGVECPRIDSVRAALQSLARSA